MGKSKFGRVLGCFCVPGCSHSSCFCMSSCDGEDDGERKALIREEVGEIVRIKDIVHGNPQTLAFQLKPKRVVLRVSMHCNGCARKVEKHISRMEGVTSFEVDLERKRVVVVGDVAPFEVLESVSKIKFAEIWSERERSSVESPISF